MELKEKIKMARGEAEPDIVLKNAKIVNVFSGTIHDADVAICEDTIVGVGEYDARRVIDLNGRFVSPGFLDSHVHIESSMVTPSEYARAVVPQGTTSVVIDPHEIANVAGKAGIKYMIDSSENSPLDVYVMVPSCVPATTMETSGASLTADDIIEFKKEKRVLGLAEMMNFPGVVNQFPEVLEKIEKWKDKIIDGHAPGLSGKDLAAYIISGIRSDHECTTVEEAREKIEMGMMVMIREGTAAKNLGTLLPLVRAENASRFCFCTDDRHPYDLMVQGHINYLIKRAVAMGLDPITAIKMATINPALYFGLTDRGAVAVGYRADLVVFDNFENMNISLVFKNGNIVAENGMLKQEPQKITPEGLLKSIIKDPVDSRSLKVEYIEKSMMRVIQIIPDQIITKQIAVTPNVVDGYVESSTEEDILKIVVVERYGKSGNINTGFVKGFGLKKGAIGSSVAHDSHNIIAVGTNDSDIRDVINSIVKMQGGLAAVVDGKVRDSLPLPVGGLMSEEPLNYVKDRLEGLKKITREMGCTIGDPFMQLSFTALPVIPELKITDMGLVDVNNFRFVSLFI